MTEINKVLIYKFFKFGVVGVSGMIVDFTITYLCKEKIRINKYSANTFGFFFAASSNFILNRVWTFQNSNPDISGQYFNFLIFSVVGVLISNMIIYSMHGRYRWNFYFAKLISIGVVLFWNFFASYFFTFR